MQSVSFHRYWAVSVHLYFDNQPVEPPEDGRVEIWCHIARNTINEDLEVDQATSKHPDLLMIGQLESGTRSFKDLFLNIIPRILDGYVPKIIGLESLRMATGHSQLFPLVGEILITA